MPLTLNLTDKWDIHVDKNGDIALSDGNYAIAQNAANAVRLFTNDAYFNQDRGIPHYDIELGHNPISSQSVLINRIREAVLNVDGVEDAQISLEFDNETRTFGGEITLATADSTQITIDL